MTAASSVPPRIFLSYSRADRDFAVALRDDMVAAGHAVWHDLKDMGAGQWWDQIAEQLRADRSVEHIVLVVSPEALASRIVEREWRLAKREGKTLSAVIPPAHRGQIDFSALPRWMSAEHHYNFSEADQRARLNADLHRPGQQPRRPDPLRKLPEAEGYVRREGKVAEIKAALLDERREAKATTVVLSGAGGFGKSTLAIDIMNDPEIQDACYDGILWVELYEELVRIAKGPRGAEALRDAIKAKIESLIRDLTGASEVLDDLDRAKERLGQLLAHKRVLIVIDDAWDKSHAKHFIEAAPEAAKLVTTRRPDIIGDTIIGVDQLSDDEALDLISLRLTPEPLAVEKVQLRELALKRAGGWPLLIRLINGQLRLATTPRQGRAAQTLVKAVADLKAKLVRDGLDALDATNATQRDNAVRLSVGVSFEMLAEEDSWHRYPAGFHQARYLDLAGFQEAKVPIATIARLWAHLGALKSKSAVLDAKNEAKRNTQEAAFREASIAESVAVLERLYALALLQSLDTADDNGVVQLHDVMRTYLGEMQGDEARNKFHRQFVLAYDADSGERVSDMGERERRYFYMWYPTHLASADRIDRDHSDQPRPFREALDGLLLDPRWLQRKLSALGNPQALVSDYDTHATGAMQSLIGRTLRLTSGILSRDERQLLPQLHGRMMGSADPAAPAFLDRARRLIKPPALITRRLSLTPPGAELTRLEGRKRDAVAALAVLADGRLVIGSNDTTRVWNPATGEEKSWQGGTNALAVLKDGQLIASGGSRPWLTDGGIRLWDPDSGAVLTRLEGHEGSVNALAVLPDGRLASGSNDDTIRLWDPNSGAQLTRLEGYRGGIGTLAVLADGSLASASGWDHNTIRLRDPESGVELGQLHGHEDSIHALAVLSDGRLASGSGNHESGDCTIRLWNVASGVELVKLEGHESRVTALAVLPDGRLVSGSDDQTIRLWDPESGAELARLVGHENTVTTLAVMADGRIASGSTDDTVRLWDSARDGSRPLPDGHRRKVTALAALPDGRVASGSEDNTIRVWDSASGEEVARLSGHAREVTALAVLIDGRLASASDDNTIRLWHPASGQQLGRLDGHEYGISTMAVLLDGRLASGSVMTVYLWDTANGAVNANPNRLSVPKGGTRPNRLRALIALADGRLIAGTEDGTIRLWDPAIGEELARLDGHQRDVNALALLPNGWLASASWDETIRLWDLATAKQLKQLVGHHGSVNALAVMADGRLVSGSNDKTIRLWDPASGAELACLEIDATVCAMLALPDGRLVAGDSLGRLHWLEIVE